MADGLRFTLFSQGESDHCGMRRVDEQEEIHAAVGIDDRRFSQWSYYFVVLQASKVVAGCEPNGCRERVQEKVHAKSTCGKIRASKRSAS